MDIKKTFKVLTSSMALWALIAVLLTGAVAVPIVIFSLVYIPAAALQLKVFKKVKPFVWTLLTVLSALCCYFFSTKESTLDAFLFFFIFLMGIKLFSLNKKRDYLQLYVVTFILILTASMLTPSVLIVPILVIYLFLLINTLIYFNAKNDFDKARNLACEKNFIMNEEVAAKQKFPALKFVMVISILMLLLSSLFFTFIPRFSTQVLQGFVSLKVQRLSGFSDEINFLNPGAIQTDPSIVMRVKPEMQDLNIASITPFYLRATSFDFYSGRKWQKSNQARDEQYAIEDERITLAEQFYSNKRVLHQRIILEPRGQNYIFGATFPVRMKFMSPKRVRIDEKNSSVYLIKQNETAFVYEVISFLEPEVRIDPYGSAQPPEIQSQYNDIKGRIVRTIGDWRTKLQNLQVPQDLDLKGIKTLSENITAGKNTPYEKANAIRTYLLMNYKYSLEGKNEQAEKHLENFLFVSKEGHCEYFATAMAVLLRSIGIPSRVVSGYCTDEWNPIGKYFTIREQNAHTWVEVLMDKYGWMSFDPTPPAGIGSNRTGIGAAGTLQNVYDTMKFFWYRYVLDYDSEDQRLLKNLLTRKTSGINSAASGFLKSLLKTVGLGADANKSLNFKIIILFGAIAIIFIIVLFILLKELKVFSWKINLRLARKTSGKETSIVFFKETLKLLYKYGYKKEPGETPGEFGERIVLHRPSLEKIIPIVDTYYRIRFNDEELSSQDIRNIIDMIEELKIKIRKKED